MSFKIKNVNIFVKIDRFRSIFGRILKIKKQIYKLHTLKYIYLYYTPAARGSTGSWQDFTRKFAGSFENITYIYIYSSESEFVTVFVTHRTKRGPLIRLLLRTVNREANRDFKRLSSHSSHCYFL